MILDDMQKPYKHKLFYYLFIVSRTYLVLLSFQLGPISANFRNEMVTKFQLSFFCVKTNKSRNSKMQPHATKKHNIIVLQMKQYVV